MLRSIGKQSGESVESVLKIYATSLRVFATEKKRNTLSLLLSCGNDLRYE